jgi:hypothetical protein
MQSLINRLRLGILKPTMKCEVGVVLVMRELGGDGPSEDVRG